MLSAFFAAHLFMEFAWSQNNYLAVKMLEELLVNCSAKELKGVDDEFNNSEVLEYNKFRMLENLQQGFSMSMRERGQNFSESQDASDESQSISDRSQIIYQDTKNTIQDLKNTLSKTESISNKRKDIYQNILNTLSEIGREDITSTPEPISSRLRSKGRSVKFRRFELTCQTLENVSIIYLQNLGSIKIVSYLQKGKL